MATTVLLPAGTAERIFGLHATRVHYAMVVALLALIKMAYSLLPGSFRWLTKYHEWELRRQMTDARVHDMHQPSGIAGSDSDDIRVAGAQKLSCVNRAAASLAKRFVDAYLSSIGSQMKL